MEIYNICLGAIYFTNIPPTIFKRRAGFTMQTTTLKAVNSKERLGCDLINAEILLKVFDCTVLLEMQSKVYIIAA